MCVLFSNSLFTGATVRMRDNVLQHICRLPIVDGSLHLADAVCRLLLKLTAFDSLCHLVGCLLFSRFRLLFDFNCKMDHKSNGQSCKVTHRMARAIENWANRIR